ncbi:MAG: ThuA domain-containing protein [Pedobacter sp.]|nr:ThuA domain-containing protein [Chitinophagaceae bacterium]
MKKITFFLIIFLISISQLQAQKIKLLAFSKTNGYRHGAIGAAKIALTLMAAQNNWEINFTEDSLQFSSYKALRKYNAVIFMFVTGKVFDTQQEAAMQKYVEKGGGFLTLHTGTDAEYDWPWYNYAVGAKFKSHPKQQIAKFLVLDTVHPSTKMLPKIWTRFDELYNFREPIAANIHVLMELDETSYTGGTMGKHPIAWYQTVKKGRVLQTALGHTDASYKEDLFLQHLKGAIKWVTKSENE